MRLTWHVDGSGAPDPARVCPGAALVAPRCIDRAVADAAEHGDDERGAADDRLGAGRRHRGAAVVRERLRDRVRQPACLPAGALADGLGARRVLLLGTAIFASGAAIAAVAPVLAIVILGQVVAGAGAAVITPSAIALVREAYPDPGERTRAVALTSIGMALGFGIGPVIGGILIAASGWRAVFAVNLIASMVVVGMVRIHVPPSIPRAVRVPGLLGVALGVVTLATLTFALIEGANTGWTEPLVLGARSWPSPRGSASSCCSGRAASRCCRGGCSPRARCRSSPGSACCSTSPRTRRCSSCRCTSSASGATRRWRRRSCSCPRRSARSSRRLLVGKWTARVGPRAPLALGMLGNAIAPLSSSSPTGTSRSSSR